MVCSACAEIYLTHNNDVICYLLRALHMSVNKTNQATNRERRTFTSEKIPLIHLNHLISRYICDSKNRKQHFRRHLFITHSTTNIKIIPSQ